MKEAGNRGPEDHIGMVLLLGDGRSGSAELANADIRVTERVEVLSLLGVVARQDGAPAWDLRRGGRVLAV
jgi:hypothetical protein